MSKKNTYYVSSIKIIDDKNPEKEKSITLKSWETYLELKWSQLSWKAKGRFFLIIFIILFSLVIRGLVYLYISILLGSSDNLNSKVIEKFLLPLATLGISLTSKIEYIGEEKDWLRVSIVFPVVWLTAIWLAIYSFC